ncbi:MAG: cyclic nucleotide-binding domain-containing protein, partial [Chloroflexi bacterium]|nr:cyclic nucleotide-binding domain-containing protein [Chloroflexota bacterium]
MTANEPLVSHDNPTPPPGADSAAALLTQIERYTAQLIAQVRFVIERFFQDEPPHVSEKEFFASFLVHVRYVNRVLVAGLDRYAPHWAVFVPDDPAARAALLHQITQHYRFTRAMIPHMIDVLKLDDPATKDAYTALTGQPIDQVFMATRSTAAESPALPGMENFDPALIADFEQEVQWLPFKRGEIVLRQGDPGDGLYIVTSGRLEIVTAQPDGTWHKIDDVGRDEIVGEMALISGDPRSATVIAARDTEVIRLSRDAFDRLTLKYPQFMMRVVRSVITRLGQQSAARRPKAHLATIAIAPTSPDVPLDRFVEMLVAALESFGPVLRLSSESVDRFLGRDAAQTPPDSAASVRVIGWLNEQEAVHRFVIYQADPRWSGWTQRCLRQADRVLFVGLANRAPDPGEIEARLGEILPADMAPRQE